MSTLEKAARAAWQHEPNCRGRSFEEHPSRDHCFKVARAVIASIEVDDAMVDAACEAFRDDPFIDDEYLMGTRQQDMRFDHYARAALKAMLRALLAEGEKG